MSLVRHREELYVLGPPIQTRDELSPLLKKVLQVILQAEVRDVRSRTIAGPVSYMSQWPLQGAIKAPFAKFVWFQKGVCSMCAVKIWLHFRQPVVDVASRI
jgi:hypothetical protein